MCSERRQTWVIRRRVTSKLHDAMLVVVSWLFQRRVTSGTTVVCNLAPLSTYTVAEPKPVLAYRFGFFALIHAILRPNTLINRTKHIKHRDVSKCVLLSHTGH